MGSRSPKSGKASSLVSTFTYYIPAPPPRKTGFREREFDKIMQGILSAGFELMDFHTQSVEHGMYVVAIVKAKNKKVMALDAHLDMQEHFKLKDKHSSSDIIHEDDDEV